MKKIMIWAVLAATLVIPTAHAATLNVEAGTLVGAQGVQVGTQLYDVSFTNQTCGEVYDGCDEASDFSFFDLDTARAAGRALFDQVLLDGPLGPFDTMPDTVRGCDFLSACILQTPWAQPIPGGFSLSIFSAINTRSVDSIGQNDLVAFAPLGPTFVDAESVTSNRVVWSQSTPVTPVPLPASLPLMAFGLLGLGWAARRKNA